MTPAQIENVLAGQAACTLADDWDAPDQACGEPAIALLTLACVHEHVIGALACMTCAAEMQRVADVLVCPECDASATYPHQCLQVMTIRWLGEDGTDG